MQQDKFAYIIMIHRKQFEQTRGGFLLFCPSGKERSGFWRMDASVSVSSAAGKGSTPMIGIVLSVRGLCDTRTARKQLMEKRGGDSDEKEIMTLLAVLCVVLLPVTVFSRNL